MNTWVKGVEEGKGRTAIGMLEDGKEVHRTDLSQLPLLTKEPENLLEAEGGSLHLRYDSTSVVGTELVASRSSGPRSDVRRRCEELDGLESGLVVGTDGGH